MPTALIVEDEPEANKLLAMLVQLRGYRTVSAFNGREALAKVDHEPPDVVFLDLMLPDVNGYEVCKALKTDKATARIPVVMVTARVAVENRIRSYIQGAERYIAKPYTPDQIFDALEEAERWRTEGLGASPAGAVRFGSRDEGETFRQIAHLGNDLLARTPLDLGCVAAITEALRRLSQSADAWGQRAGADAVAELTYRAAADRVELTLREVPPGLGWLSEDPRPPAERWPEAAGCFDEAVGDPGGPVTLIKRFPRGDNGTAPA